MSPSGVEEPLSSSMAWVWPWNMDEGRDGYNSEFMSWDGFSRCDKRLTRGCEVEEVGVEFGFVAEVIVAKEDLILGM